VGLCYSNKITHVLSMLLNFLYVLSPTDCIITSLILQIHKSFEESTSKYVTCSSDGTKEMNTPPRRHRAFSPLRQAEWGRGWWRYGTALPDGMGRARTFIRAYSVRCATELAKPFVRIFELWSWTGESRLTLG
jgi:hypothetical protein